MTTTTATLMRTGNGPREWWYGSAKNEYGDLHVQLFGPFTQHTGYQETGWKVWTEFWDGSRNTRRYERREDAEAYIER